MIKVNQKSKLAARQYFCSDSQAAHFVFLSPFKYSYSCPHPEGRTQRMLLSLHTCWYLWSFSTQNHMRSICASSTFFWTAFSTVLKFGWNYRLIIRTNVRKPSERDKVHQYPCNWTLNVLCSIKKGKSIENNGENC